jgi:hypothetical protein
LNLKHYRGRSTYSKGVQAAEYFARRESGLIGIDDMRLHDVEHGDQWLVRFRTKDALLEVSVGMKDDESLHVLTCKAEQPRPIARYELKGFRVIET